MNTPDVSPPPVPKAPIQYAHFEGTKNGLHTAGLDRDRIEIARSQAQAWINENPHIKVESIDSAFGNMLAIVTVWFREY